MPEPRLPTDEEREASKLYAERLASVLREQGHPARVVGVSGQTWWVVVAVEMVGFKEAGA